jgi:hypothetical protein
METLSISTVKQFSYGHNLLLPFSDLRSDTSSPVSGLTDTWAVTIVKPDGTSLSKTTGLDFPDVDKAEISVPIDALDLNLKGDYWYQVVKTTSGAQVISEVASFTVSASLPSSLPLSAPTSPSEHFFPIYGAQGQLLTSLLRDNAGTLEYNGSPLGGARIGGTIGNSPADGSILFVGTSGVLAQDNANLFWNDASNFLKVGNGAGGDGIAALKLVSTDANYAPAMFFLHNNTTVGAKIAGYYQGGLVVSAASNYVYFGTEGQPTDGYPVRIASHSYTNVDALHVTATAADQKPIVVKLALSQTANAVEVNSNGGSGGDKFRVTKDGHIKLGLNSGNQSQIDFDGTGGNAGLIQSYIFGAMTIGHEGGIVFANSVGFPYYAHISSTGLKLAGTKSIIWTDAAFSFPDAGIDKAAAGIVKITDGSTGLGKIAVSQATPASSSDSGFAGTIWADATYIYVQTASGTIKRVALSTF